MLYLSTISSITVMRRIKMLELKEKTKIEKSKHAGMFPIGVSGNPTGRPKSDIKIRDLAREHTPAALNTLVEIMKNPNAKESSRVQAASAILDRAYGKPPQSIENINIDATQTYREFLEQLAKEEALENGVIDVEFDYIEPSLDELAEAL